LAKRVIGYGTQTLSSSMNTGPFEQM